MTLPTHAQVVEAFNELGYTATFAAVARQLTNRLGDEVKPETLYLQYESREGLGEAWLEGFVPEPPEESNGEPLHEMFSHFVLGLLSELQSRRDFARAWLAAVAPAGAGHLPQLHLLHDKARSYFEGWLNVFHDSVALPDKVDMEDAAAELADGLCAVTLWLIMHWAADRTSGYGSTQRTTDAIAYLLDALLVRRKDLGEASLLVHLHRLLKEPHDQDLVPLLDSLLPADRARRWLGEVPLLQALRLLRPPPANPM